MRHVIIGTAGHIDHGKSALVKALTGVDPDRLKEEKARGITIDLGFAHMELDGVQVGFVDVPGHEKFVKNMLAGVGGIDCVLLVVAADESLMPQTREHFDICRLLGVSSGIVAITKVDLVEPDMVELVREEILDAARGSFLERAEIVPVSSRTGEGLERLKQVMRAIAVKLPVRPAGRLLRLPIDRAFSMRGFGTVVTGTLASGSIRRDDEVELIPGGISAKVRGLQVHGKAEEEAFAGQRTAVNLQGIDLAQVSRGMTVTASRMFRATRILDVRIDLLPSARPLKSFTKVRFHQGTSEVLARVALLGQPLLEPGNTALAQLRLDAPAFCLLGDAFILRQFSPATTIGGGRILNPLPVKHRVTDREALTQLRDLEASDTAGKIAGLVMMQPGRMMSLRDLQAACGLPESDMRDLCTAAAEAGRLIVIPGQIPVMTLPEVVRGLKKKTVDLVGRFHRDNPLLRGISREELRNRVYDRMPPEVFRFCLEELSRERKISNQEDMVAQHGREVQLTAAEQLIREKVESHLRNAGWQPPTLAEISSQVGGDEAEVRRICFWMLKEKILVRITEEILYPIRTIEEMKGTILTRYPRGSHFGVAEFKELFGLTRKHAIPLLEYFDRERFTRRQGSERILL